MHGPFESPCSQVGPVVAAVIRDVLELDAPGEERQSPGVPVFPVLLAVGVIGRGAGGPAEGDQQVGMRVGLVFRLAPEQFQRFLVELEVRWKVKENRFIEKTQATSCIGRIFGDAQEFEDMEGAFVPTRDNMVGYDAVLEALAHFQV